MIISDFEISHKTSIRVRYADTDKMGVVYNAVYLVFFEVGRTELMRKVGLAYTEFESYGYHLPLTEAYIKYIQPAFYDDELIIEAKVKPEYKPTITFEYNIFKNDTTIVIGSTIHSFINENMKAVKPPKIFIDTINNYYKQLFPNK